MKPNQTIFSDPVKKAKESWKLLETGDKSFIFDLFVGQLQSSLECMECGHISLTYDPFWDLSLPLFKVRNFISTSNIVKPPLQRFFEAVLPQRWATKMDIATGFTLP